MSHVPRLPSHNAMGYIGLKPQDLDFVFDLRVNGCQSSGWVLRVCQGTNSALNVCGKPAML